MFPFTLSLLRACLSTVASLALLFGLATTMVRAQVVNIPIPNGDFEANQLFVEGGSNTAGFQNTKTNLEVPFFVSGWVSEDGNNLDFSDGIGTYANNPFDFWPGGGYNKSQFAFANARTFSSAAPVAQIMGETEYTLTARVGERVDTNNPLLQGARVQLLANGVILTPTVAITPIPDDNWVTWVLQYDIPAGSPLTGQNLTIRLGRDDNNPPQQADFDNVTLTSRSLVSVAPEPSSLLLLIACGLLYGWRRVTKQKSRCLG